MAAEPHDDSAAGRGIADDAAPAPALTADQFRAFDLIEGPVWLFDPASLRILDANRSACDWLGYDRQDLCSRTIASLRPWEERDRLRALVAAFDGDRLDAGTWHLETSEGVRLRADFRWRRVCHHGRTAILASIGDRIDLTRMERDRSRLQSENAALRHAGDLLADRFCRLFEAAPGRMLVLRAGDHEIVAASEGYAAGSACAPADLRGRRLSEVLAEAPGTGAAPVCAVVDDLLASLTRVEALRCADVMPIRRQPGAAGTGTDRYWSCVNSPVLADDGTLAYILHRVEDVTALIRHGDEAALLADDDGAEAGLVPLDAALRGNEMALRLRLMQEQQARLRSAESLLDLGVWEADLDSGAQNWSPRMYRLFGLPEDVPAPDAVGTLALIHPDDRGPVQELCRAFLDSRSEALAFEHRVLRPDGSTAHIRCVGARHDVMGRSIVMGFAQDVTGLVQAARELEFLEQMLELAGRQARLGGWRVDLNPERLTWTRQTAEIYEIPHDQVITVDHALTFYPPGSREKIEPAFRRCAEEGQDFDVVCELVTARGNRRWVRSMGTALRDVAGRIIAVQGAFQDISELRAAEDAAAEARRQRIETLENIRDAFFTVDHDWRITYLNREAERLLGKSRTDLLGRDLRTEFIGDEGRLFIAEYSAALATGEVRRFRHRYSPLDGWFEVSAHPVPEGLAVHFRCVTAEVERSQHLRLLESAVSRLNDIVVIAQASGPETGAWPRVVYVNDAFERLTGYGRAEILGETFQMLHGPGTDRAESERVLAALGRGEPVRSELMLYTRARDPIWLALDILPVPGPDGGGAHLVAVLRDVTSRRRADETLRVKEERFRLVAQATDDVIRDWDITAGTVWWNPGLHKVFGRDPVTMAPGLSAWTDHIHPEDRARVLRSLHSAAQGTLDRWTEEYRFRRADGSYATVLDRCFVIRDANGAAIRLLGSMADLTERLNLERRLRESQRLEAMGQLTGGVAHDFNNLLTVILGNAELLAGRLGDDRALCQMAEMIVSAADRGAELTGRLLAFARRQALRPRVIDVNHQLRGSEPLFRRTLSEDIEIAIQAGQELWPAEIDPGQLEVALLNLVLNARDAMPQGGRLVIETANVWLDGTYAAQNRDVVAGQYAMVAVSDTGTGMAPETMARAFEPFFTTKEPGKGSGLGLSMVFGFVRQSGGHIRILSEPGQGTSIRLYFPRAVGVALPEPERPGLDAAVGGHEHILVVEDDDPVRESLAAMLRGLGYRVSVAASGPAALALLPHLGPVDLLLTDVVMPGGMSGRDLADAVRLTRPDIRVLYSSGYSANEILQDGHSDPGVELLSKPYRRRELAARLRKLLDGASRIYSASI